MNIKISLFALPYLSASLLLAGCSSNTAATDATDVQPAITGAPQTTKLTTGQPTPLKAQLTKKPAAKPTPKPTTKSPTKPATHTATANTPDPAYKVVDEAAQFPPQAPAVLRDTLHKVAAPPPPKNFVVPATARVTLQTSQGNIVLELNGKEAPLHVKSFLYLAQRGYFDGSQFHRYEPGFVIQGGDPLTKFEPTRQFAGAGGPGYRIPREHNSLNHATAFVVAAARTADPDSAGSQFYITLDAAPHLDDGDGYTVFGRVVSGDDVALKLRANDALKKLSWLARRLLDLRSVNSSSFAP